MRKNDSLKHENRLSAQENKYDYLEKKYGIGPEKIFAAIKKLGYSRAKIDAYFMVQTYLKNEKSSVHKK